MFLTQLNYPPDVTEKTPIIVTLHGMGATYDDLQPVAEQLDATAIHLHIQANVPFGSGYAFFVPDFSQHTEQEVIYPVLETIHQFVQQIMVAENLTNHPLIFLGFSQGAMISLGLTFLYPNWLSQAFLFSARMPAFYQEFGDQSNQTAVFISQGQMDPLFPVTIGRTYSKYVQEKLAEVEYHEYPVGHGIHPQAVNDAQDFYQHHQH